MNQAGCDGNGPLPPPDAAVFTWPRKVTWGIFGLILGCGGLLAAFGIFGVARHHEWLLLWAGASAGFAAFAAYLLWYLKSVSFEVRAAQGGIWRQTRTGGWLFLRWSDVARARANDFQGRLELADASGERAINVDYACTNSGRLLNMALAHVRVSALAETPDGVYRRTWTIKLGLAIAAGFLFWASWGAYVDATGTWALLFAVGLLCALAILKDPAAVLIEPEGIVVSYPGWRRHVRFSEIDAIGLEFFRNQHQWLALVIRRRARRPIRIFRFKGGSLPVYSAAQAAWRAAGGGAARAAGPS